MLLTCILYLISTIIISIAVFNIYFYFLIKKEEELNLQIDNLFLNMFVDGYLKINTKKSNDSFKNYYKSVKSKVKNANRIFEKIERLKKYSFIKVR